jgi:hypothetical protein
MKPLLHTMRPFLAVIPALLLLSACAKEFSADADGISKNPYSYDFQGDVTSQAIGTVKTRDGIRFIQLDAVSAGFVVNPNEIQGFADGTRVYLQYWTVLSTSTPDFCTDAILVEWASPIEKGGLSMVNFEENFSAAAINSATYSDPMDIVTDWMTCLEDGFLTLHYMIPTSGEKKHEFSLYRSLYDYNQYYLIHQADGDTKGSVKDGIVCFDVSNALSKTGGKTVELSFVYIDLNHTEKRLTFEYCSPK